MLLGDRPGDGDLDLQRLPHSVQNLASTSKVAPQLGFVHVPVRMNVILCACMLHKFKNQCRFADSNANAQVALSNLWIQRNNVSHQTHAEASPAPETDVVGGKSVAEVGAKSFARKFQSITPNSDLVVDPKSVVWKPASPSLAHGFVGTN